MAAYKESKETPKKPENSMYGYYCGECTEHIYKYCFYEDCAEDEAHKVNYCPICGQRQDWSEVK